MIKILKKYMTYNIFSTIMAIFGIVISFYFYFMANYKELNVSLINKIDLINVNEPLENLDIKYRDKNIYDSNLILELYTIKFENKGNTISEKDFDSKIDFGINVNNGEIVEIRMLRSQNKYLERNLNPVLKDNNKIIFDKRIIDSGNSFFVDFVILKEKNQNVEITINGKISDIKDEIMLKNEESKTDFSTIILFFNKYTFISILILLILIFILGLIELFLVAGIVAFFDYMKNSIIEYKSNNYFGKQIKKYSNNDNKFYFSAEIKSMIPTKVDSNDKMDRILIIDSFLSKCYKNNCLYKLKYQYDNNINSFIEVVNLIKKMEREFDYINQEIEKIEDTIMVTDALKLSEIKGYSYLNFSSLGLKTVSLYLNEIIYDDKYRIYKSFMTLDLDLLIKKRYDIIEEFKSKIQQYKDISFIDSYNDIDFLINHEIILVKDLSGQIIEEKTFITRLNDIISYFGIKEENL